MKTALLKTALLKTALLMTLLLAGCTEQIEAQDYEHTREYDRFVLTLDAGNVILGASSDLGSSRGVAQFVGSSPEVSVEVIDRVLQITGTCGERVTACIVDFFVDLLPATPGNISVGAGTIQIRDLGGDLTIDLDEGTLDGRDLQSSFLLARAGGATDLAFSAGASTVDVETPVGDLDLEVPAGAYRLDLAASLELSVDGVQDDPASAASLRAHASAGALRVQGI